MVYVAALVIVASEYNALAPSPSTRLGRAGRLAKYALEDTPRGGVREMILLPDAMGERAVLTRFIEVEEWPVPADAVYFMERYVREEDCEDTALLDWVGGPNYIVYEVVGVCLQLRRVDWSVEVHVVENYYAEGRSLQLRFRSGRKPEFEGIVQSAECVLKPRGSLESQVASITDVVIPSNIHQTSGPRLRVLADDMKGLAAGFLAVIGYGDRGYRSVYEIIADLLMPWENAVPEAAAAPCELFIVDPLAAE